MKTPVCCIVFLVCGLLASTLAGPAQAKPRTDNDSIAVSCGPDNATKKILIAYDTIHGSTAEIAARIGNDLCNMGLRADTKWVGAVTEIDGYDGCIVASPIYKFAWLPDALAFLDKHHGQLASRNTAFFIDGASMSQDTPETREAVKKFFIDPVLEKYSTVQPVSIGLFGGAFDLSRKQEYGFFEKIVLRVLGLILRLPDKTRADWRNWQAIDDWALEAGGKM